MLLLYMLTLASLRAADARGLKPIKKKTTPDASDNTILVDEPAHYNSDTTQPTPTTELHISDLVALPAPTKLPRLQKSARTLKIYATIQSESRACFQKKDGTDYFYRVLESYRAQHLQYLGWDTHKPSDYRVPYDEEGFVFKRIPMCTNPKLSGVTDLVSRHLGARALYELKVMPYCTKPDSITSTDNGTQHIAGLVIRVKQITLV